MLAPITPVPIQPSRVEEGLSGERARGTGMGEAICDFRFAILDL